VPRWRIGGKAPVVQTGMAVAPLDLDLSDAPDNEMPALSTWGGARNRADRVSDLLPLAKAQAVIGAAHRAIAFDMPLNRFVTVHWTRAGVNDDRAAWATGRLIKLASDWVVRSGGRIAWTWVRENDDGDGSKGSHVHILLHCPDTVPIGRKWLSWLSRITGRRYRRGTIKSVRIGGSLNAHSSTPAHYRHNLDAVLAYVCKGVHYADGVALGLPLTEPSGRVIGKRAAWSQNLGSNSRVLAGTCSDDKR
jgi:hypothetical protein